MNHELPDVEAGFRKGRGTRDQIASTLDHRKSKGIYKKKKSVSSTMLKSLTMWITANCRKFLKRWEYKTTSWEICMQVKKQQLELNVKWWPASKLGKEYVKVIYCHSAYLIYIQSTSWGIPSWMKHQLESKLPGEKSTTSDRQMTPP